MTIEEIDKLILIAQTTHHFIFDTEYDYRTNHLALIQIFFMLDTQQISPLLIVELFFKIWLDEWLQCSSLIKDDTIDTNNDTLIITALVNDLTLFLSPETINRIKLIKNEAWGLQDSIAYIFHQYLSKKYILQRWSRGLDPRFSKNDKILSATRRSKLIEYVTYDCLSVAQLILFMYNSHIPSARQRIRYSMSPSEYQVINTTPAFGFLFQNEPSSMCACNDEPNDYWISTESIYL
ncbi:unnamed protein product [Rotaria sordida]|uniref:Uncharacterized protein n=1 Tax=Rotaria sordida TaxID=392033 RepID=A0A815MRZ9_9BILA|nr:unnamed protein product [Rotaria sordida]